MAKTTAFSVQKNPNMMTKDLALKKCQWDDDDGDVQATGGESNNNALVSRPRGHKQSRHVDVDVDAEDEEAISNTANSMETLGDTVDEGEDDELIHENMGESKKAWEKRLVV